MSSALIALLVLGIVGSLAQAGSGLANYFSTKKTNEQNQQNYEDWKAYNTPTNQMERLREAGLNPYMVSNVNNTLSQPFQVGQNTGIAEALNGLGSGLSSTASNFLAGEQRQEQLAINRENVEINKQKLKLQKFGLDIRERMAKVAEARNEPYLALLATQGSIAELNRQFLQNTLPYRSGKTMYDYLNGIELYNYNKSMFPLQLRFYEPYMRGKINSLYAGISATNRAIAHQDFMESFAQQKFWNDYYWTAKKFDQKNYQFDEQMGYKRDTFNKKFNFDREKFSKEYRLKLGKSMFDMYDKMQRRAIDGLKLGLKF